jgi:hypothetical protein
MYFFGTLKDIITITKNTEWKSLSHAVSLTDKFRFGSPQFIQL